MILEHVGKAPKIDPDAYVAPTATVCGDVTIGPGSRSMFGSCLISEGQPLTIGEKCIVMENAVVRSTDIHPTTIGGHSLIGPHAHVVGCIQPRYYRPINTMQFGRFRGPSTFRNLCMAFSVRLKERRICPKLRRFVHESLPRMQMTAFYRPRNEVSQELKASGITRMQISNNSVLTSGGGSSIGLELAKASAGANNKVIICGRDEGKLKVAESEMQHPEFRRRHLG